MNTVALFSAISILNNMINSTPYDSCGSLVVLALAPEGFHARNPIPLKIRRLLGLLHLESYVGGQTSSWWRGAKVWRGNVSSGVILVI
ncbi:hypothetical protein AVEN_182130-1 [Araneus ventricosus]|uniref:Uncharacterized protein n=1 Tax=Araneus ventricosus TaxID=182803 RepID=A0A4Y2GSR5_ARAVE|nr:hypothetical protein AVEN_182130-1 [Araneus ventricosus]